eukprot:3685390-Prymnesium_polylepis.1
MSAARCGDGVSTAGAALERLVRATSEATHDTLRHSRSRTPWGAPSGSLGGGGSIQDTVLRRCKVRVTSCFSRNNRVLSRGGRSSRAITTAYRVVTKRRKKL